MSSPSPMTKAVRDLVPGDRVRLKDPEGIARIRHVEKSRLFRSPGGCFRIDMTVVDGPHKGEQINDQHHAGDDELELAGKAS